ncbi:MAG: pseudouridine synthase [Acholeplasmataceae bacterium]|nr:pseudouridine synthase [Acholeplasmataceae bacterium]
MATRINKYLSESGFCSRREADRLILENRVKIDGQIALLGSQVEDISIVTVDGKPLTNLQKRVYLAFNKPIGITSTTDTKIKGNMIDYIHYPERIFHIGRLDKDSEGLILLTNDGDIVNQILRAENAHEKEYLVTVDRPVTKIFCDQMAAGVPILNTVTRPCIVKKVDLKTFKIILTEGLNRQIRRMCAYFGYNVLSLKRIRIMHIHLDIPTGKYRPLTKIEEKKLFEILKSAS